jgi:SAM-dependent methyltransferase
VLIILLGRWYRCIRTCVSGCSCEGRLKMSRHREYQAALRKGAEKDALFLDVGCCFGYDVRKLVLDGFPADRVLASDLEQGFWDVGNRLFTQSPKIRFIAGDIFDDSLLAMNTKSTTIAEPEKDFDLQQLTSLTPLQGKVTIIHASSIFHLFPSTHQLILAKRFAALLSPTPGSMIFGEHIGLPVMGAFTLEGTEVSGVNQVFCHSPESWKAMWDGEVFEKGTVRVEAEVREWDAKEMMLPEGSNKVHELVWSVHRL